MTQTIGLNDDLVSAAVEVFLERPETLVRFLVTMSSVLIEGRALAGSRSPFFADTT